MDGSSSTSSEPRLASKVAGSGNRPDVRVIVITAHGTIDSAVEAMKHGAVDYIQKPFAPKDIRELVSRILDRQTLDARKAQGYAGRADWSLIRQLKEALAVSSALPHHSTRTRPTGGMVTC